MSLVAHESFWNQRSLIDCMNKDTIVSIMGMTKEELNSRVKLATRVLTLHSKGTNILDGKLDDNMFDCVTQYKDMLNIMHTNPLEFEVPKNRDLGFGMGGLRSTIG